MVSRNKRVLEQFDPNASDPDDSDYRASSPPSSAIKAQKRGKFKGKGKAKAKRKPPPRKKQRNQYSDSDDDVIEDDDEGSEESFVEDESSEEDREINPRTGKPMRGAAKKAIKYEESEADEDGDFLETIEEDEEESEGREASAPPQPSRPPARKSAKTTRKRRSLIVMLKLPTILESSEVDPGDGTRPRRSSRISHDDGSPLIALTKSGKGEQIVRPGTRSPSVASRASRRSAEPRSRRASKALKKPPSTIVEASYEILKSDVQPAEATTPMDTDTPKEASAPATGGADVQTTGRNLRSRAGKTPAKSPAPSAPAAKKRKRGADESSDFEPGDEDGQDDVTETGPSRATSSRPNSRGGTRRSTRGRSSQHARKSKSGDADSGSELDRLELAEEAEDLAKLNSQARSSKRARTSRTDGIAYEEQHRPELRDRTSQKKPNYVMKPLGAFDEDEEGVAETSTSKRKGRNEPKGWQHVFSTEGPFGGYSSANAEIPYAGGVDSDSSEEEEIQPLSLTAMKDLAGQTPPPQLQGSESRKKPRHAVGDINPVDVGPDVSFDKVGGLDDHINKLKEMVSLPLLYPEVFKQFGTTPPRGVLFHGPPGTGKTLLARALASSISQGGKKVSFYMRKGGDALSKWVGEAEKQMRDLFEHARANQPSIIFFDEIDGIAPVRSGSTNQMHASIVATLLALMDGMDDRGQVVVIGATNRPDTVDPALRRPGRFDREFYFPLPNHEARKRIIDIHTSGWQPPVPEELKGHLATLTKGYGGADIRSLCTEASLNAIQGTYPQIYQAQQKLVIDPTTIKVTSKDFMLAFEKLIPSGARAITSNSAPLTEGVEPLLRSTMDEIMNLLDDIVPQKKSMTALEAAMYDDRDDVFQIQRDTMAREFERSRVFRPRLLIKGAPGMGQQYIGQALMNRIEGLHVQHFDLGTLFREGSLNQEMMLVQVFAEVRRHSPSVIFLPNIDLWWDTVSHGLLKTFQGLVRSIPPNEPVMILGITEAENPDQDMMKTLFNFTKRDIYTIRKPTDDARREYFGNLIDKVRKRPSEFPDPEHRKKRKLPVLPVAPAEKDQKGRTPVPNQAQKKAKSKTEKRKDLHTLLQLKQSIQPIMDQIRTRFKKFRFPPIEESAYAYLLDERNPKVLSTDLTEEQRRELQISRPYEWATDKKGEKGILETATGKFFYNLNSVIIEERLQNGYYKRFCDFTHDVVKMCKDALQTKDAERIMKGKELRTNVKADIYQLELNNPALVKLCNELYEKWKAQEKAGAKDPFTAPSTTEVAGSNSANAAFISPLVALASPSAQHGAGANSNGTNGSARPADEDVEMTDSHPEPEPAEQTSPTMGTQKGRSQHSVHTLMAQGSQPGDYHNSASTTTSGQKTQSTNGGGAGVPDFSAMRPVSGDSQIPDTQEMTYPSSQNSGPASQPAFAVPTAPASISSLLNSEQQQQQQQQPEPELIIDEGQLAELHGRLAQMTAGYTVEQLELVNSRLMAVAWELRGEWNRTVVASAIREALDDVYEDIKEVQGVGTPAARQL
ncbi:hypothetical protein BDY21DRAFT_368608 [Lineolata rhizophorae]|uniref:AAA+ ATPase domain-containing protein n=1 Tax=Lineolata rhizophorae TaxID=578093 RepID=A0A6A6PBK3_9PEZI|nr:hypothetical protein BDY21DRAFT_368608 [Lineolata rhizophorae]